MTQETLNQEVTKEEAEYQELQEHLGIIKALTDRARSDLLECIKTIASRDKEALTVAAKSLAKNLVAVEQYAGNIAKELVTEKIISASLVNALDNLTKPQEVNNDSVPEEAPKAKSINIIHPDADENVIARGEIPNMQQVDDMPFKEEEIDEIIYGNEEAKETSLDEKVTEAFDKVRTLVKDTKEPDYNQWVNDIKEQLKNDTVRSILDRKVYFIASSPLINETPVAEDPNHADITQYIEVIDAESLKYILIERHAKGHVVNDTVLFEVDDQDVVEDHVFGRVNRHRYVGPDNKLTTLAKSLIKEVPNQHAFHHPYIVSSADC
jgi:hypothetical protein|nr:MAG TPA: hypothetical protein [Caudoviricetes sp.]